MKWFKFSLELVAVAATVLIVGAMATEKTAAQYPPPTGNVSLTVSSATPTTGTVVSVSARVVDQSGAAAAGLSCTFQLLSQPGTGAIVDAGPKISDINGMATTSLSVGTTAGTILIGANCGLLSSQVAVEVASPAGATLPSTGMGPVDGQPYGLGLIAALLIGGLATVGAGSALFVAGRRVRAS